MRNTTNMHSKVLPLGNNSPIKYDLMLYMETEALLSNSKTFDSARAWYMTNYTQFYSLNSQKSSTHKPNFYKNVHIHQPKNPFIKEKITTVLFYNSSTILNYIFDSINKGRYVKILLDHFYLPGYGYYKSKHVYHTEFIFGYDLNKRVIYVIGSNKLKMGGFNRSVISFDSFIESYFSSKKAHSFHTITALSINESKTYIFNIKKMYKGIISFYNSKMRLYDRIRLSNDIHSIFKVFGLATYQVISSVLRDEFKMEEDTYLKSIKYLQAFADYRKVMLQRIKYLYDNDYLTSSCFDVLIKNYTDLIEGFTIVINLYLKNYFSPNPHNEDVILNHLDCLYNLEKQALFKLITCLKAYI